MNSPRRCPPYWFHAAGEVAPERGAPCPVTLKELSLYGCYLDTDAPLDTKGRVLLKIFGNDDVFEANAWVIYVNPRLGMGLVFREVKPNNLLYFAKAVADGDGGRKAIGKRERNREGLTAGYRSRPRWDFLRGHFERRKARDIACTN
jgi:hypothetical protein